MSNTEDEALELPSPFGEETTDTDRLGPAAWGLYIERDDEGTVGWSERWERRPDPLKIRTVYHIPHLNLSQLATMRLAGGQPFHRALGLSTLEVPSENASSPFYIIRATFPLYQTGEAALHDLTLVLDDGERLSVLEMTRLLKLKSPKHP